MELRICSKARPAANMAKEDAKGTKPLAAKPAATHIMSASAMPQLKWRSGYALANMPVLVEPARSASSTTTFSCAAPRATRPRP